MDAARGLTGLFQAGPRKGDVPRSLAQVLRDRHVQVVDLSVWRSGYGVGTGLYAGSCYILEDARSARGRRRLTVERQRRMMEQVGEFGLGLIVVGPAGMEVAEGARHVVSDSHACHGSGG